MSSIITIRTLSQLPEIKHNQICSDTLFEACPSVANTNPAKYRDAKVTYNELSGRINADIESALNAEYNLSELSTNINDIVCGNRTFSGTKEFKCSNGQDVLIDRTWTNAQSLSKNSVTTKSDVEDILSSSAIGYISSKSTITAVNTGNLSAFSQGTAGITTNPVILPASGILHLYGWLADQGSIASAQAWVALEAFTNNGWQKIAICPWSTTAYSSQLGYVSFNVPAAKGLQIRVATGFMPNMTVSGAQNVAGSLATGNSSAIGFKGSIISTV